MVSPRAIAAQPVGVGDVPIGCPAMSPWTVMQSKTTEDRFVVAPTEIPAEGNMIPFAPR